jgi:hypothetical protein
VGFIPKEIKPSMVIVLNRKMVNVLISMILYQNKFLESMWEHSSY